jgi:hypothetical protein
LRSLHGGQLLLNHMLSKLVDTVSATKADPFHAREGFRPTKVVPSDEMVFAHWTERVSAQSEFVTARELCGLSDQQLSSLAAEFEKSPRRRRTDWTRHGYPVAAGALAMAAAFAVVDYLAGEPVAGTSMLEVLAVVFLVLTFIGASMGSIAALRAQPLEAAYARLGLQVSVVADQHPWLYKTHLLVSNQAANEYRLKTLRERGPLRGADYLMMREIASAHEAVQLTQTASSIARLLQGDPSKMKESHTEVALESGVTAQSQ